MDASCFSVNGSKPTSQSGFTLIELMISIVLGLLIVAATLQIMLTSQNSLSSQEAGSNLQADAIFGLGTLKKSIRAVNYDAFRGANGNEFLLNNTTPGGGLVLTVLNSNLSDKTVERRKSNILVNQTVEANIEKLVSKSSFGGTNLEPATGTLKSDQLVLQYKVADDNKFDCEGNAVTKGLYVVERYFLRVDSITTTGEPNALALACNAVSYGVDDSGAKPVSSDIDELKKTFVFSDASKINNNGTILMNRVDHFHVLLGVETGKDVTMTPSNSRVRYMSISDYCKKAGGAVDTNCNSDIKKRIVSIRFGLVVRSGSKTQSGAKSSEQRFDVLDQKGLKLKSGVKDKGKYQRQVFESTVILRNGRG